MSQSPNSLPVVHSPDRRLLLLGAGMLLGVTPARADTLWKAVLDNHMATVGFAPSRVRQTIRASRKGEPERVWSLSKVLSDWQDDKPVYRTEVLHPTPADRSIDPPTTDLQTLLAKLEQLAIKADAKVKRTDHASLDGASGTRLDTDAPFVGLSFLVEPGGARLLRSEMTFAVPLKVSGKVMRRYAAEQRGLHLPSSSVAELSLREGLTTLQMRGEETYEAWRAPRTR